ncbi:hypothetical protein ABIE66_001916 [Peribacillus sp. B2I2]
MKNLMKSMLLYEKKELLSWNGNKFKRRLNRLFIEKQ